MCELTKLLISGQFNRNFLKLLCLFQVDRYFYGPLLDSCLHNLNTIKLPLFFAVVAEFWCCSIAVLFRNGTVATGHCINNLCSSGVVSVLTSREDI